MLVYADKEQGKILLSQPVDTVTREEGIGLSISLEEYGQKHCTYYLSIEAEEEDGILSNNQELIYTGYGTGIQGGSLIKDPVTYTVTFDSNGGSKVESQSVIEGRRVAEPVRPAKEGYRFSGWYAGETPFDFSTVIDRDMTIQAVAVCEGYEISDVAVFPIRFRKRALVTGNP